MRLKRETELVVAQTTPEPSAKIVGGWVKAALKLADQSSAPFAASSETTEVPSRAMSTLPSGLSAGVAASALVGADCPT